MSKPIPESYEDNGLDIYQLTSKASSLYPEQELWAAVLQLAVHDAIDGDDDARSYILMNDEVDDICDLIGLHPDTFRKQYAKLEDYYLSKTAPICTKCGNRKKISIRTGKPICTECRARVNRENLAKRHFS